MLFLTLLACALKPVYYSPTSYAKTITSSGESGEFYILSDIICDEDNLKPDSPLKALLTDSNDYTITSRVTLCKYDEQSNKTTCQNIADTVSLNENIAPSASNKFTAEVNKSTCVAYTLEVERGESGWNKIE